MKFSIIIPAYNSENTLCECLSACLNQSYKDFEIIVIDNSSKDDTVDIIQKKYKDKIILLEENKKGAGFARNKGIQNAKGDVLVFIDSDCIADKEFLKNIQNIFQNNNNIIIGIVGSVDAYSYNNIIEKTLALTAFPANRQDRGFIKYDKFKLENIIGSTSNFAVKADYLKSNKLFFRESRFSEDIDLFARILKNNNIIAFAPQVKVYHKNRSNLKDFFYQGYCYGRNLAEYFILHNNGHSILHFFKWTFKWKKNIIPVWINLTSPDKNFIYIFLLGIFYRPVFLLLVLYFIYLAFKLGKNKEVYGNKINLFFIVILHVMRFFVSNISSLFYSIIKGCIRL